MIETEKAAFADIAERTGAQIELVDDAVAIEVGDRAVAVPIPAGDTEEWASLGFRHALPGRARGDQREMLLSAIARDASPRQKLLESRKLREALPSSEQPLFRTKDGWEREQIAAVLADQYFVRRGRSTRSRPFLFPFHAAMPANFKPHGQYKMFRGDILCMLCWDGSQIDAAPVQALCDLLNDRGELSLLDEVAVDAALEFAGPNAPDALDSALLLNSDQAKKVTTALAGLPAFAQANQDRFRQDLQTATGLKLPRHDRVAAAIQTMALHLALYYYEVAARLGQGLESINLVMDGQPAKPASGIVARMQFRVGTAGDRPVRGRDGCAQSWRELDDGYLIALTPNIMAANLLHGTWKQADPEATTHADPSALADAMEQDPDLSRLVDAAAAVQAVLYSARIAGFDTSAVRQVGYTPLGAYVLRSVLLDHRRKTLKHMSRDVVNQMVRSSVGVGGSLIRTRGSVTFFELDEEFLFLLVKFVLVRVERDELEFNTFLRELANYGLVPQDDQEERRLAEALEGLGMLVRYSDAGEATYVRHAF